MTQTRLSRHDEDLESLFFDLVNRKNQETGTPHRARVFAVKVAVIAALGAVFSAVTFELGLSTVIVTLAAHGIHHLPAGVGCRPRPRSA